MKKSSAAAALLVLTALQGCTGVPVQVNLIESVALAPGQSPALGSPVTVQVKGSGHCVRYEVDWGDGASDSVPAGSSPSCATQTDASGVQRFTCNTTHTYSGWGGGKTVTVFTNSSSGCEGRAMLRFSVPPPSFAVGFNRPGPNRCDTVSGMPPLANRTLVKITTEPTAGRCGGIFYTGFNPHCYDAEGGDASAITPVPTVPFPTMRAFSLVLSVGTQMVQGGTNMSFITNQAGPLTFCVNEPDPKAGNGGYVIRVSTDQLGPVPPP